MMFLCLMNTTNPRIMLPYWLHGAGLVVLELQNKLPKARILYVSATGASESRHVDPLSQNLR
jgi:hypothetical protein